MIVLAGTITQDIRPGQAGLHRQTKERAQPAIQHAQPHPVGDMRACVCLQTAISVLDLKSNQLAHTLSDEKTVIWRGKLDAGCKATGKTGPIEYAITFEIKDDLIVSYDELVHSGMHDPPFLNAVWVL